MIRFQQVDWRASLFVSIYLSRYLFRLNVLNRTNDANSPLCMAAAPQTLKNSGSTGKTMFFHYSKRC